MVMAEPQPDTDMVAPAPLHGQSVLLVEDDIATAQMYKMRLELDGYLVLTAAGGESALSIAEKFEPDLVVLDIGLPGMNGLAFLDAMRANDRLHDTPVLILTNFDSPDAEKRSLDLGAGRFLLKSETTPDALAAWVRRFSKSRNAKRM
jgi:two-component system, chemotaxis family, CheB/CheR fusion protein